VEARLHISLPAAPGAAPAVPAEQPGAATPPPAVAPLAPALPAASSRITLIYPGADGFATLLDDFKTGSHVFRLPDFRTSYGPIQWKDLSMRMQQAGLTEVRVFLDARPSDDMQRFLNNRAAPAALPTSILE
jgi:hypothetical protein